MIETRGSLCFTAKTGQRFVRFRLVTQHPFHRDDAARVSLLGPINYAHAPAPDLLENFVITQAPFLVRQVYFREDAFKNLARRFPCGFQSFQEKTTQARSLVEPEHRSAPVAFYRRLLRAREGFGPAANEVHGLFRSRRQGGAEIADLGIDLSWIGYRVGDFIAEKPPIALTQIVQLLFDDALR